MDSSTRCIVGSARYRIFFVRQRDVQVSPQSLGVDDTIAEMVASAATGMEPKVPVSRVQIAARESNKRDILDHSPPVSLRRHAHPKRLNPSPQANRKKKPQETKESPKTPKPQKNPKPKVSTPKATPPEKKGTKTPIAKAPIAAESSFLETLVQLEKTHAAEAALVAERKSDKPIS